MSALTNINGEIFQNTLRILTDLIKFQTVSGKSNIKLIEYCENELKRSGASSFKTFNNTKTQANLFSSIGANKKNEKEGIILSGHTDVVPAVSKEWTSDPYTAIKKDNKVYHVKSLSSEISKLSTIYNKIKPSIVLVTGDRAEMFAAAFAAVYMGIPVAHIQAGDLSGHIDGSARHAITKISHLHFASCSDSRNRVLKMGEEKWRVFNTGAVSYTHLTLPTKA